MAELSLNPGLLRLLLLFFLLLVLSPPPSALHSPADSVCTRICPHRIRFPRNQGHAASSRLHLSFSPAMHSGKLLWALGISILLTDFFRSKGNQHLSKISICPQISATSLSNISVPHSLHFKGELQKHACLRLLFVKAKINVQGTRERKGRAGFVKTMPQALSLLLKHEGHLCYYKCYFFHKPELNCSPDKTMFASKQNTVFEPRHMWVWLPALPCTDPWPFTSSPISRPPSSHLKNSDNTVHLHVSLSEPLRGENEVIYEKSQT